MQRRKVQHTKTELLLLPTDKEHAYGADNSDPWSISCIRFCGESQLNVRNQ
ncbi:AraC family ligand binding domain-containing protein [Parabacteroides sp. Marseille-P3160]|uniref:AraC family ligand binding domain-containing protein n=1 Tax=Parabacteroides sp. Marseille-P3160 TaxID=1917887 RepID=UPI00351065B7